MIWLEGNSSINRQKFPCYLFANLTPPASPLITQINFSVRFYSTQCLFWDDNLERWSDKGCHAGITLLEDNNPLDSYVYLIIVFTGMRKGAGTTARVTIAIHGLKSSSLPVKLFDKNRPVLHTGSEDWFLMTSRKSLGELTHIHIWHDNSGDNPKWYLNKLIIRDVKTNEVWCFPYNNWLAVDRGPQAVCCTLIPIPVRNLTKVPNLFRNRTALALRENHLWASVFCKQPHSQFTRVQRLSCVLSLLLTTMLANIMFYGVEADTSEQLVIGNVNLSWSHFSIGISSSLIVLPINIFIVQVFRMSRKGSEVKSDVFSTLLTPQEEIQQAEKPIGLEAYLYAIRRYAHAENTCFEEIRTHMFEIHRELVDWLSWSESRRRSKQIPSGKTIQFKILQEHFPVKRDEKEQPSPHIPSEVLLHKARLLKPKSGTSLFATSFFRKRKFNQLAQPSSSHKEPQLMVIEPKKKTVGLLTKTRSIKIPFKRPYFKSDDSDDDQDDTSSNINRNNNNNSNAMEPLGYDTHTIQKVQVRTGRIVHFPFSLICGKDIHGNPGICLPWWCVYVAWTLVLSSAIISSYLVMLYGLNYGYKKSVDWLISMSYGIVETLFISQPLKVLLMSIMLTFIFRQPAELHKTITGVQLQYTEENFSYLLRQGLGKYKRTLDRRQSYKPPKADTVAMLRKRRLHQHNMNTLLRDLVIFTFFILVLSHIVYNFHDKESSMVTETVHNVFIGACYWGHTKFTDIKDVKSMWDYISRTLQPNLFLEKFYNGKPAPRGYTSDLASRLVGVVRLRQLRASPDQCIMDHRFQSLGQKCVGNYFWPTQDIQSYKPEWRYRKYPQYPPDEWTFQSTLELRTLPFLGKFALYSGGGYARTLTRNSDVNKAIIFSLANSTWIDDHTRALMIEFTLFNSNTNLFSIIWLAVEFSGTGAASPSYNILPVDLLKHAKPRRWSTVITGAVFIILLFVFGIQEVKKLYYGRKVYLLDCWTYVELGILAISIAIVVLFIEGTAVVDILLKKNFESEQTVFISFHEAAVLSFTLSGLLALLIFLVTIKLWRMIMVNKVMSIYLAVLDIAAKPILHFSIMVILILVPFAIFGMIMFGSVHEEFNNSLNSYQTLLYLVARAGKFSIVHISESSIYGRAFLFIFTSLCFVIFLCVFRVILIDSYHSIVQQWSAKKSKYDFWEHVSRLMNNTLDKQPLRRFSTQISRTTQRS